MACSTEMDFFHSNFMVRTPHEDDNHNQSPLAPILPSCSTSPEFQVVASLLGKRQSMLFSTGFDVYEEMNNQVEDELSDYDGSQFGEKKRRLNVLQVKTLEKNFELGNKLEPERKMQLARALGLHPRQIAIWFQNRRARWKTKKLEKDYDILKRKFEVVKGENDDLQAENQKLHAEILALRSKEPTESINLNKETEGSTNNRSENSSEIKLETSRTPAIDSPMSSHPNRPLFQSSLIRLTGDAQQLYQRQKNQYPKLMDQTIKEENLCNMLFVGTDEQTGFWPWLDHQNFN